MLKQIPTSNEWINVKKIERGFDNCTKYYFERNNQKYILKIFSYDSLEKKEREFCILKKIQNLNFNKPNPVIINKINENNYYYILTWIEGETLTKFSNNKSEEDLYEIGLKVGDIMYELHQEKFNNKDLGYKLDKMKNKLDLFKELKLDYSDVVVKYLEKNMKKLLEQPKSIVHGDLNQDNIIIDSKGNIGIIDFGNSDIDYSYQDTHQIQMYNRFLSEGLSAGIINGYLKGENNSLFWECYKIYSAYYCLSKIIWAYKFNDDLLIKDMLNRARKTIKDFDYFKNDKPIWYEEYVRQNLGCMENNK